MNSIDVKDPKWKYLESQIHHHKNIMFSFNRTNQKKLNCSNVMFKLVRHKELPNISHKKCRRIGLMCSMWIRS